MRCDELRDLLDLYLDDELADEARRKMDRHLLRCPGCSYEARTLEQTRAMLRETIEPAEATSSFRERTLARLLDSLAPNLRPQQPQQSGRQWSLDLLRED
jgi:anti-sigma factor RsiW